MFKGRGMYYLVAAFMLFIVVMAVLTFHLRPDRTKSLTIRYLWTAANGVSVLRNQMLPMRDGVRLATDIYLPRRSGPPYPVVFVQTPYNKHNIHGGLQAVRYFVKSGYAVAVQDLRGRYRSEGQFEIYRHAVDDGWDSLTWLAEQPWSNGNIGTFGCSALGEIQYLLANAAHPNHKAMIVEAGGGAIGSAGGRHSYFGVYEGGVAGLASSVGWFSQSGSRTRTEQPGTITPELLRGLPIIDLVRRSGAPPTDYEDYLSHPPGDPWWDGQPYLSEARGFSVPGLHVNSWFDFGVEDTVTLALGQGIENPVTQKVIISPASHCESHLIKSRDTIGDLPIVRGNRDYGELYRNWFDHWLKGGPEPQFPKLDVFVLGGDRWISFDDWPPPSTETEAWYLSSDKGAQSAQGDGVLRRGVPDEGSDSFVYDPMDPVPTRGGSHCCTGNPDDQPGSFDQSESAKRQDVLVYDSEVISNAMTIVGPLRVRLSVATSVKDTDFTAKLVDVWPDGRAFNIQDGVFRLRYRDGFDRPTMATAGEVYEIEIGLRAVAYEIHEGHRLRLEVSSSNFPRLARNLNTGGQNHLEVTPVIATNTVFYGGEGASRLLMPICKCDAVHGSD